MLGMEVAMRGLCGQSLTGRVTAKAGMQGRRCSVKYGAYLIRCSSRENASFYCRYREVFHSNDVDGLSRKAVAL